VAFEKLLAHLDEDGERAGERYEALRRKLVKFFMWHGDVSPEEHADETIDRVARRMNEGEEIQDFYNYCYGVARLLLREVLRERAAHDRLPPPRQIGEKDATLELRLKCLDDCLESLPPENRELVLEYYQAEKRAKIERRKSLAADRGIPLNALRIRAHRIRAKLETCVNECLRRRRGEID
jgi:DNA-directed RNA polymerase specialized sigma24 family protein